MTFVIFHDFPGLENGLPKFHDFRWPGAPWDEKFTPKGRSMFWEENTHAHTLGSDFCSCCMPAEFAGDVSAAAWALAPWAMSTIRVLVRKWVPRRALNIFCATALVVSTCAHLHINPHITTRVNVKVRTHSDVNKDWTCEDKDQDQAYKDQNKDKDLTHKDQDKDLNLVLKNKDKDLQLLTASCS